MSRPEQESHEPVVVTDKRRIDPVTGEVREGVSGPAPSGSAPEAPSSDGGADKVAELTADLQRVQAEFANYRKRALRDQQVAADRAKAAVLSQLLGVLDDLDRARSHGDLETGPLRSVAEKLTNALESLGLSAFGEEGDEFDPQLHEAVQHEGEGTHPILGSVLRRGYRLGDQVLRHALVGVVDTVPDEVDAQPVAEPVSEEADLVDNAAVADDETAESESSTS